MHAKFGGLASAEALAKTVKALEEKKMIVKVVKNEKEALEYLMTLIPDGSSVSSGGSTTLDQIGYSGAIQVRDSKVTNYKGKAIHAMMSGNSASTASTSPRVTQRTPLCLLVPHLPSRVSSSPAMERAPALVAG